MSQGMKRGRLTDRQAVVLAAILQLTREGNGRLPTNRGLRRVLGTRSSNGIHDHILALVRKGYVAAAKGRHGILPLADNEGRSVHLALVTNEEMEHLRAIRREEKEEA